MTLTKNTEILRAEVAAHINADALVRGAYWKPISNAVGGYGCFISCLTHSSDPTPAFERFGLPVAVLRIAESIFEALPDSEGRAFFAALPDAVGRDGKDLSRVHWGFLAAELRAMPQAPDAAQAVIDPVIEGMDLLFSGQQWPDARAAADAAYAAARAASYAAYAASYAAYAAAYAADAAADAADAAADAYAAAKAYDAAYAAAYAAATAADAAAKSADAAAYAAYGAADASCAAAYAADAADAAAQCRAQAAQKACAAHAADAAKAYAAADAAYAAARLRQRDTLLALIAAS